MNTITTTVAALAPTLCSGPSIAEYTAARAAYPALVEHATPAAALAALAEASPHSLKERDAIVLAMIAEHKRTRHPLWQALLLTAYAPMLHRVARRTLAAAKDDARQGALVAFLSTLDRVRVDPAPKLLSLHLRQATERVAFGASTSLGEPETVPFSAARRERDPRDHDATIERDDQLRRIVAELVDLFGDEAKAREILDVLLVARNGRAPLLRHLEEKHPRLTGARLETEYGRVQRMRARALARLQQVFGVELEEVEIAVA